MLSTILHGALAAAVVAVVQLRPKPVPVSDRPIAVEVYTEADITRLVREVAPRKDRPAAKPGRADRPAARSRQAAIDTKAGDTETDSETTPVSTPSVAPVEAVDAPPPPVPRTPKSKPQEAVAQVASAPEPKPAAPSTPRRTAARQPASRPASDDFGLVLQSVAAIKQRQSQLALAPPAPASRAASRAPDATSRTLRPLGPARQIPARPPMAARTGTRQPALSSRTNGTGRPVQTARRGQAGSAAEYYAQVEAWLSRHQHYPLAAKRARQQGKVVIEFTMNRAGRVLSHRVLKSSGHRLLDRAAEQTVMIAAPLPPVPAVIPDRRLTLMFSIKYDSD